ncbi:MAG: hypothetical protein KZQ83_05265 [gamma proteobacterium symbiont of Taylorina sp.]|nr:hypothetical protein [gamma proteobacterium symbiont of Taylorina sp.]
MIYDVSDDEKKQAKWPHDLFLINLIGNHILTFVATLGMASSWAWPMLSVPVISFTILGIIFFRGKRSRTQDSWYVMCHWQLAVRRSLFFIKMMLVLMMIAAFGVYGYMELGWMKEAVYAVIGGGCILPIMVTTLVLILMESDALHQAEKGEIPEKIVKLFPNPKVKVVDSNKFYQT